ncbi:DUF2061 domain-containing protein [Minwuia thermotolerans]|uniref:DUF2061 domain-containing protein n=1 Tax=Minwuia thermotolerans TaxID=2056226 RepID=A0A2M9G1J7_9PROT|nr:DUF2061 domain-containing protein [Minwuia thermotolerans]PJK29583.1 hypothetical protein CVT23_11025 [Minwuia thermotolerans]
METTARTLAKALSWQTSGLIVMTLIGYIFTGSISAGGGIAAVSATTGFAAYFLHERVWAGVGWGRRLGEAGARMLPGAGR